MRKINNFGSREVILKQTHKMSNDTGNEIDNQIDEEDRPFLRERVYYAAKDGLPIAMYALLNNVKDDETKNAIINQVSVIH